MKTRTNRAMRYPFEKLRLATQWVTVALMNCYLAVFPGAHIYKGSLRSVCLPVLNCQACPTATTSCPVGSMQHFAAVHKAPLFLLGVLGLFGLAVGRMACGWICPFGLLQDLLYRIRSAKIRIPAVFSMLRYFVLVLLVVLLPYATGESWFSMLCPMGTLEAALPWTLWNPVLPSTGFHVATQTAISWFFVLKVLILGGFIMLFVVAKRPFCRLVCPVGLFFSFFNRISLLELRVAPGCTGCNRCQEMCPVDIKVYEDPNSGDCIRCLRCTSCRHVTVASRLATTEPKPTESEQPATSACRQRAAGGGMT